MVVVCGRGGVGKEKGGVLLLLLDQRTKIWKLQTKQTRGHCSGHTTIQLTVLLFDLEPCKPFSSLPGRTCSPFPQAKATQDLGDVAVSSLGRRA